MTATATKPTTDRREEVRCPACGKFVVRVTLPPGRAVLEPYCPRCKQVFVVVLK